MADTTEMPSKPKKMCFDQQNPTQEISAYIPFEDESA